MQPVYVRDLSSTYGSWKLIFNRWVFSSDFAALVPTTYRSSASNTSRSHEGSSWGVCYHDQSCIAGEIHTETVSTETVIVDNQTIGVVTEINSEYKQPDGREGFLGLSLDQNAFGKNIYFFVNLC